MPLLCIELIMSELADKSMDNILDTFGIIQLPVSCTELRGSVFGWPFALGTRVGVNLV